ncbi:MAG: hypothetical protein K8T10_11635 [Candidatus Eremiobacteraeota bacterium]|nr:hypothetical protein [Candidatus Eremiobacteraeota bacterium]
MKNKAFKVIAILMVLAFTTILMGCGGGSSNDGDQTYTGSWTATKQAADTTVSGYAGTYSGNFIGEDQNTGTFTGIICSNGYILVHGVELNGYGYGYGTINANGAFTGTWGATDGGTGTFTGSVTGSTVSGLVTINGVSSAASFSGTLQTTDTTVSGYAGGYNGSFTGEDAGSALTAIGNEGSVILLFDSTSTGLGAGVGAVTSGGTVSGIVENYYTSGTYTGTVTSTGASGSWSTKDR